MSGGITSSDFDFFHTLIGLDIRASLKTMPYNCIHDVIRGDPNRPFCDGRCGECPDTRPSAEEKRFNEKHAPSGGIAIIAESRGFPRPFIATHRFL